MNKAILLDNDIIQINGKSVIIELISGLGNTNFRDLGNATLYVV